MKYGANAINVELLEELNKILRQNDYLQWQGEYINYKVFATDRIGKFSAGKQAILMFWVLVVILMSIILCIESIEIL